MLRPVPSSVREARRYVRNELAGAGFDAATYNAELLVSELVTNVILHARTPARVTVEARGDVVRIGVADDSTVPPTRRRRSATSGTGRGLLLVDRLATRWGVDADTTGKVVWFELPRRPDDGDGWGDLQEA